MSKIGFADALTKQTMENWPSNQGWDACEKIQEHMDQLFFNRAITIVKAIVNGDSGTIKMMIESDGWERPREFVLDSGGSLFYDEPPDRD